MSPLNPSRGRAGAVSAISSESAAVTGSPLRLTIELAPEQVETIVALASERAVEQLRASTLSPSSGWLRGARAIGDYIGAPPSRVYALSSAGRIPVEHDGSALIAQSSRLDDWLRSGGGKRP